MKESLPTQILNEKLPRFLQKCAESFESDKRYKNDSRFIRVWLQLVMYIYPLIWLKLNLFCAFFLMC